MAKMKSKLRPDPQLILDDMNGVVPENQANQDASESTPADVPASLRESERRAVEALGTIGNTKALAQFPSLNQTAHSESYLKVLTA